MNIDQFNPNDAALLDAGIFGLPHDSDQAEIIVIPLKWEVTVSYGSGASEGPDAVIDASYQVDLCHHDYPDFYKKGVWVDSFPESLVELNQSLKSLASNIIFHIERGEDMTKPDKVDIYRKINDGCVVFNEWVKQRVAYWKNKGKTVCLLGGDHSTPLGYHQYLAEKGESYGVLTIDAHKDLRNAYEGFQYSHASIFYNVLQLPNISKMVQVGIRDYCHEEKELVESQADRVKIFYDRDSKVRMYEGETWKNVVDDILAALPEKIYISVDIDGLDPTLCPSTGTPVPGGLAYEELMYLFNRIKQSKKTIIGFDLCEVSPGENDWNGNVGARVLYHMCAISQ